MDVRPVLPENPAQREPNQLHRERARTTGLVRCDGTSARGPHSALDIHLLSDHLSVTFPRLCPAWSPAKSSAAALTCIVGVSLGFGESHVRPAGRDKCSHT